VLLAVRLEDVRVSEAGAFFEQLTGRLPLERLADPALLLGHGTGVGMPYVAVRRGLDLLLAALGLALAAPLGLLVAVAVKLESRGPVLYRQERVGRNGRLFTLAKFRSMRVDAEAGSGPVWADADDPRITRVGRWLRKLRIDEIPQLWSVIRNDMSLVGPRPERPYFVAELERQIPGYGQRHVVKPGITGWAQINYSYGNSTDDAFIKLQYDLYYVKHRSLALDIAILLRTVKVVVLQQGAV
jgi:exopolysaccharide biosynthesis polyprenyl glycosylphosphotransferase